MQEMQLGDQLIREFFTTDEVRKGKVEKRRKQLEAQGAIFVRREYWVDPSKYMPHQSTKEMARRVRQMERAAA